MLKHPNVMRLEEIKHDQENLFIVVEQCDTDLKKYFDTLEEALPGGVVRDLIQQVLSGLLHCHSKQILHRDLKPQNILVNLGSMQVKLADFGLARAFGIPVRCFSNEVSARTFLSQLAGGHALVPPARHSLRRQALHHLGGHLERRLHLRR